MASTKNIKGAAVLNNAFDANFAGGDGKELCATDHPTLAGTLSNEAGMCPASKLVIKHLVMQKYL